MTETKTEIDPIKIMEVQWTKTAKPKKTINNNSDQLFWESCSHLSNENIEKVSKETAAKPDQYSEAFTHRNDGPNINVGAIKRVNPHFLIPM